MKKRPRLEREFGVPLAGEILDPARWVQTALKKLPPEGPLDFAALFGRRAPVVLDVGCGNGRFLIGSAVQRPDHDHLGVDLLPMVLRYATRRGNQRGLGNLRFACIDGQRLFAHYLAPQTIREVHCYHPQPYHAAAERSRRLLTPHFFAQLGQVLEPQGTFFVQTDNLPYWRYLRQIAPHFLNFTEQQGSWPDAPRGRTRREIWSRRHGYAIYRGYGTLRTDLADAAELARTLPPPDFDAGPKLQQED